mmetsp:Transcript_12003/g.19015  ORF Transcript_12003/g.19015 Transcript_12003/m.19015 type:complete len:92 (+) Transcript_12003:23-298(+)
MAQRSEAIADLSTMVRVNMNGLQLLNFGGVVHIHRRRSFLIVLAFRSCISRQAICLLEDRDLELRQDLNLLFDFVVCDNENKLTSDETKRT